MGGGGVRVGGGGGQGRCELRSEAFVNIQKNIYFFWGGGGRGRVGGVRVDVKSSQILFSINPQQRIMTEDKHKHRTNTTHLKYVW